MDNEAVVLIAKEFGWTLDEIGKLAPTQVQGILEELLYQKRLEDYLESYRFAFLASVICNLVSKEKVSPEDFIGALPKREGQEYSKEELLHLARRTRKKG